MFEEERQKLTETITLLEEDIKGLLEDNKTLRQHNENLLDKVEANKEGQEQDSADMNENILNILVNSLSKLAQIPMMEAFIMMKNQSGFL
jgi:FtsZ-binding cell division protein ZapB